MWIPSLGPRSPRRPWNAVLILLQVGALLAFLLLTFQAGQAEAAVRCEQNLHQIRRALTERERHGRHPATLDGIPLPACPATGDSSPYRAGYRPSADGYSYVLHCFGVNHVGAGLPVHAPRVASGPRVD